MSIFEQILNNELLLTSNGEISLADLEQEELSEYMFEMGLPEEPYRALYISFVNDLFQGLEADELPTIRETLSEWAEQDSIEEL